MLGFILFIMKHLKLITIATFIFFSSLTNFTYAESLTFSNGTYEGEIKKGKAHGLGIFDFSNGSRYVGKFKKNKLHGKGVLIFPDGVLVEGKFRRGTLKMKLDKDSMGGKTARIKLELDLGEIKKDNKVEN
jgi:hypothetical protein